MFKKICIVFLLALGLLWGKSAFAAEQINSFDVNVRLSKDASFVVTENIVYDFGEDEKHGIYRDIIYKYKARGGNFALRITNISVTDEKDAPYNFEASNSGIYLHIKIGDANRTITGAHTYKIQYTVARAINYFKDHDEFYWNATGNEWQVPILKSSATVEFPGNFRAEDVSSTCFAGTFGSTDACTGRKLLTGGSIYVTGAEFKQSALPELSGLTVVVGLPSGTFAKPTVWQTIWETIKDNFILFLPALVFVYLYWRWYRFGRDPKGRGTVVAQYEAPDNLTPAEVGVIYDEKVHAKDLSAEIISLAVRGYMRINRTEKGKIFKSPEYEFEKLKPGDDLSKDFDKELYNGFFKDGDKVTLSDLRDNFYKNYQRARSQVYANVTAAGYFGKDPGRVRIKYIILAILCFFWAFFIGAFFGGLGIFSFLVCGIMIFIFGMFMPARTQKGVEAKEYIEGLKLYMTVAEKDRINFHNAPEKNPQRFEKLLPFAMALGVENEWAKQFEGIYNQQPSWYNDPTQQTFTALLLINSLSTFQTQSQGALVSSPSSAGSGGSGFSGGGSGGGFGGGGGGSW
jgi:uncharacterized membrane protein